MTERTKIERVGGHLLIGESAIPIASMRAFSCTKADVQCSVWSDNDGPIVAHGWTAREVLEVAYGGGEWLYYPKPTDETRALVDEIESQRETIRSLHTALDDLTRAGLEMERAKNEEIAVLREALRRSYDLLKKYNADEDEADANTVEVICHIVLDIVDMLNPGEQQDEYASIRKAAGVER